jgi:hypothetical protein
MVQSCKNIPYPARRALADLKIIGYIALAVA